MGFVHNLCEKEKINGLRLNKNYVQVTQEDFGRQDQSCLPLYQALESNRINMVVMILNTMGKRPFVSGTIASKKIGQINHQDRSWAHHPDVCTLSIYPHHYRLRLLGVLVSFLGSQKLQFHTMVSSNAMVTFVIDQKECDAFIKMLTNRFDLPDSHVPFEQEENDELTQFLKKKYPETRATYEEEKIKTYGITLVTGLTLSHHVVSLANLAEFGQKIQSVAGKEGRFFHTLASMGSPGQVHFSLLTDPSMVIACGHSCPADFLSFQGPHFGDRHSIISRAIHCLSQGRVPLLQTGCTGAHIGIVVPRGQGKMAKKTLQDVFDCP